MPCNFALTSRLPFSRHLLRRFSSSLPPPTPPPPRSPLPEHAEDVARCVHSLCASSGDVDSALRLLDRARLLGHRPSPGALAAVLRTLCRSSRPLEAHIRALLAVPSLLPDHRASNALLSLLLPQSPFPKLSLLLLRRLLTADPSFVPSPTVYNRLVSRLAPSDPLSAYRLLLDMRRRGHPPDTISYTALLDGLARPGHLLSALQVFDDMLKRGVPPNSLTYSALAKAFLRKRMFSDANSLIGRLWTFMAHSEDATANVAAFANLVDSLCREGLFHEVFRIAEEMPQGTSVNEQFAYAQMIDSLCWSGRNHGASRIVYIMRKRGFIPSLASYNCIVHNLSKEGEGGCMRAYQLFQEGLEFGYSPCESTYRFLVEALCRERDLKKAREVTRFMLRKDGSDKIRIYNVFLSALRSMDDPSEQLNVLVEMLQDQCRPDVVTLNTIIHGFCKIGKVDEAKEILNDMLSGKFCSPDAITFSTVMSGLLEIGRVEEALDMLYVKMQESGCKPSTAVYNAVIHRLCKHKEIEKAMEVLGGMSTEGAFADNITYTVMIAALLEEGRVQEAKRFWDEVIWPSGRYDDFVYAAVLRGLCKLGELDGACDFLYELVDCGVSPGIMNYNILIDGACKLGLKKEAYRVVGEMKKNGLRPDAVTWRILDKLHRNSGKNVLPCRGNSDSETTSEDKCPSKISTSGNEKYIEEGNVFNTNTVPARDSFPTVFHAASIEVGYATASLHPLISDSFTQEMNFVGHHLLEEREPLFKIARRSFLLHQNVKKQNCLT